MHEHECMSCPARFDCDHELMEDVCPVSDCRRCRERLHASGSTADLMPIDYYAIKNATTEATEEPHPGYDCGGTCVIHKRRY